MTDTERTDDAAFTGDAADELGDATQRETDELTTGEDGSAPAEPQPTSYPNDPETVPEPDFRDPPPQRSPQPGAEPEVEPEPPAAS